MSFSFFQQVQPKTGTGTTDPAGAPGAPAGAPAPQGSPPSMVTMLLPFLILVPFLFLSFRRQKKEKEARSSLKKGDRVVTQAGLIGELVDLDERIGKVKIAPGTTVQVLASALSPFETVAATEKKTDKDLEDLKEAKAGVSDKK
jgi:preprotein translocase subunit YajC